MGLVRFGLRFGNLVRFGSQNSELVATLIIILISFEFIFRLSFKKISRLRKLLKRVLPFTEPSLPKFKKFKSLVETPELPEIIKHYIEFIHDLEIDNMILLKLSAISSTLVSCLQVK